MSASHQVWHRSCGTLLLHSERPLSADDMIRAEGVTLPDGTRPAPGAPRRTVVAWVPGDTPGLDSPEPATYGCADCKENRAQ